MTNRTSKGLDAKVVFSMLALFTILILAGMLESNDVDSMLSVQAQYQYEMTEVKAELKSVQEYINKNQNNKDSFYHDTVVHRDELKTQIARLNCLIK